MIHVAELTWWDKAFAVVVVIFHMVFHVAIHNCYSENVILYDASHCRQLQASLISDFMFHVVFFIVFQHPSLCLQSISPAKVSTKQRNGC